MKNANMRYRSDRRNTYFMWRALQRKAGLPYDVWADSWFFKSYSETTKRLRGRHVATKTYAPNGAREVARRLKAIR